MSEDESRNRSRFQHKEREGQFKPPLPRRKRRSKSTDSTRKCRHNHRQPTYIIDDDRGGAVSCIPRIFGVVELAFVALSAGDRDRSRSPTPRPPSLFPVPPPPKLKKKPSVTMPGSLFPRSPSLVPDKPDRDQHTQAVPPSHDNDLDEAEGGLSWTHSSAVPSAGAVDLNQTSIDQYVSPWRTRSVASVKDAVYRFNATEGVEADFSLMLPSPHASPVKPVSKSRSINEASSHHPISDPPTTASRKGKERARDGGNDDDLDFIVGGSSGHDGVHAKERELDAAREEQREHEKLLSGDQSRRASDERERDKRRIKALEEEVRWLKEEVCVFCLYRSLVTMTQHLDSSREVKSGPLPLPPVCRPRLLHHRRRRRLFHCALTRCLVHLLLCLQLLVPPCGMR